MAITISFPRCINRCAAPIRTRRSIISPACWMPASRRFISGRRVVRMAIEDIGLADPQALVITNAAKEAYDFLGSPEGELALAQAVALCGHRAEIERRLCGLRRRQSRSPKADGSLVPPKHILNAPTNLMKSEGYGPRLHLRPRRPGSFLRPELLSRAAGPRRQFYNPPERGFEREIKKRLDYWAKLRKEQGGG